MAGAPQSALRLRVDGRVVLELPVDAVRRLAAACRMVDVLLRRSSGSERPNSPDDDLILARMFPPVDPDDARNEAFGARRGPAVRAEVAGAVRCVLADLTAGGDVEVDSTALHRWFVGTGALRWLDRDRVGGPARPRAWLVSTVHEAVVGALLAIPVGVVIAPVVIPAGPDRTAVRSAGPGRARGGVSVGFGALTICAVLVVAGLGSWLGPAEPEAVVGTVPAPAAPVEPAPPRVVPPAPPARSPINDPRLVVVPTSCTLPAVGTTNDAVETWAQAAVTCLDGVWRPVLAAAGVDHRRPAVMRYRELARTGCGDESDPTAFYCGDGEVIAVSPSRELTPLPGDDRPGWLLGVMGHEYGHHVQELAGILPVLAEDERRRGGGDTVVLENRRRAELQATCYAGLAVAALAVGGSVREHDVQTARERLTGGGDDAAPGSVRDHGTVAHQALWLDRGLAGRGPAACDTWAAVAAEVE